MADTPTPPLHEVTYTKKQVDQATGLILHETTVTLKGPEKTKDLLEMARKEVNSDGKNSKVRRTA